MENECLRHKEQMAIENRKMFLEERRLLMDEEQMNIKTIQLHAALKKEIAEHNMDMLDKRMKAKHMDSDLTPEMTNSMFPFRMECFMEYYMNNVKCFSNK